MYDTTITKITAFSFLRLPLGDHDKKCCVVKVEVTWQNCMVCYSLTPITDLETVGREVVDVIKRFHCLPISDVYPKHPIMRLSQDDLQKFWQWYYTNELPQCFIGQAKWHKQNLQAVRAGGGVQTTNNSSSKSSTTQYYYIGSCNSVGSSPYCEWILCVRLCCIAV